MSTGELYKESRADSAPLPSMSATLIIAFLFYLVVKLSKKSEKNIKIYEENLKYSQISLSVLFCLQRFASGGITCIKFISKLYMYIYINIFNFLPIKIH